MAEKIVRVRIVVSCAGEYDGKTYGLTPRKEYDLPEGFAKDLIKANYAVPVKEEKTEKSTSKKRVEKNVL